MSDIKIDSFDPEEHLKPENKNQQVNEADFYRNFELARRKREATAGGKNPRDLHFSPEQMKTLDPQFLEKLAKARAELDAEEAKKEKTEE